MSGPLRIPAALALAACALWPVLGCQTTPPPSLSKLRATLKSLQEKAVEEYELGEYTDSLATLEKIEILSRGMDDLVHLANAYNNMAAVHFEIKDFEAARKYLNLALALNRKSDAEDAQAAVAENLLNLGSLYTAMGNQTKAEEYSSQAEKVFEELGDESGLVQVLRNRGKIKESLADYPSAIVLYSEAQDRSRSIGDFRLTASILADIGGVRVKMGEYKKALAAYRTALRSDKDNEIFIGVAKDLRLIGAVYEKIGDLDRALEYHLRALNVYRIRIGHVPWIRSQIETVLTLARKLKDKEAVEKYTKMLEELSEEGEKKKEPQESPEKPGETDAGK
jgi:tetratricopeptide (TPR) repeat protein